MRSVAFERDASGTFVGSSFAWSSARDVAKFGLLYLRNGWWNGEQLLPADWVQYSIMIAPSQFNVSDPNQVTRLNRDAFGAQWWLNKKLPYNDDLPYPGTPEDAFFSLGFRGQTLAIIPSLDTVIVRLGTDGLDRDFDRAKFMRLYVESTQ